MAARILAATLGIALTLSTSGAALLTGRVVALPEPPAKVTETFDRLPSRAMQRRATRLLKRMKRLPAPKRTQSSSSIAATRRTIVVQAPSNILTGPASSARSSVSSAAEVLHGAAPALPAPASVPYPSSHGDNFPAFEEAIMPVSRVPRWGSMRTPEEWTRAYAQMNMTDFVPLPMYSLKRLMIPLESLMTPRTAEQEELITEKLTYSTRYYGAYDLDSGEFNALHPGIDIKLAADTPIGAVAGGRVQVVARSTNLGLYVIIEHRHEQLGTIFSVYGHFSEVSVTQGDNVRPGQTIGYVGMTGNTTSPHLHLQIDRDTGNTPHVPYYPSSVPSPAEAAKWTLHPISFVESY